MEKLANNAVDAILHNKPGKAQSLSILGLALRNVRIYAVSAFAWFSPVITTILTSTFDEQSNELCIGRLSA